MRGIVLTACILALALAVGLSLVSTASAVEPEQYCVVFEKAARKAVKDAIKANFGDVIKKELKLVDVVVVSLSAENTKKLEKIPGVMRVYPDRAIIEFAIIEFTKGPPPDKGKPKGENLPWGVDRIDADKVWDPDGNLVIDTPGAIIGSGIKVAIVDTGIDFEHPDLHVTGGLNTVEGQNPDYPDDEYGHGTICAGVVAALDNDVGYIGVAPGVELYAVKLCGAEPELPLSRLYAGMEWCITKGMQVINMSFSIWTMKPDGTKDKPLHDIGFYNYIQQAYAAGTVLVAAATNDGARIEIFNPETYVPGSMSYRFPASYEEVIAVSATGITTTKGKPSERQQVDYLASWSNFGPAIELAAPGVSVETTANGGGYTKASGTSLSCPHVVGVAALALAAEIADVRGTLQTTAEDLGDTGWDEYYGYGLVDAGYAIVGQRAPRLEGLSPTNKLATTWGDLKSK